MYVKLDPHINVALDPEKGVIGEMDERIIADLGFLHSSIEELDRISMEIYNSLDPTTAPFESHPGREGLFRNMGKITNFIYGLIAGMLFMALVMAAAGGLI